MPRPAAIVGTATRSFVEIGCGNALESNAANLVLNHGWHGVFFDGDTEAMAEGRRFFGRHPNTFCWPPKCVPVWITKSNVNGLVSQAGYAGEIDLLSIDIDGMDYWIWDALTQISPRVVVIEYQTCDAPDRSVVTPYSETFCADREYRHGASLLALTKLAKRKGYRLIGTQRFCFNAIFMRNDVGRSEFPEISVDSGLQHPKAQSLHRMREDVVVVT